MTRSLLFDRLDLREVTLFGQDWGGLIGLRLAAEHPDRFARIAIGNTGLPTGDERMTEGFLAWREFSQKTPNFDVGWIVGGGTVGGLPPEVAAAYDAPFPDDAYKAGARAFPVLVPASPDDPAAEANRAARGVLEQWTKPFLTLFSDSDPVTGGGERWFQAHVAGAAGQPHATIEKAGHFLQEDKGEVIAERIVAFLAATPEV